VATAGSPGAGVVSVAISSARRAELGPRWDPCCTVAHGHQRSPTVTDGSEEPQVGACPAQAAGMMHAAESNFGPEVGSATPGSRRAATGVRNDRGARPQTVEDHDRRSCHRRPLTWRFSRVFPGPQHHAAPCKECPCRSRTEEARGSNPLTSTPKRCRSERRQRRAGDARRMLGLRWGRERLWEGVRCRLGSGCRSWSTSEQSFA